MDRVMQSFVENLATISEESMAKAQQLGMTAGSNLIKRLKLGYHPDVVKNSISWFFANNLLLYLDNKDNYLKRNYLMGEMKFIMETAKQSMKLRDAFQALMYFVSNNIENGILTNNITKGDFFLFDQLSSMDFTKRMFDSDKTLEKTYVKNKKTKSHQVFGKIDPNQYDISKIVESHRKLKEHYLDKLDTYSEEDILEIMDALCGLGVEEQALKPILEANCCKRRAKKLKNEQQEKAIVSVPKPEPIKSKLSYKEYNQLKREVSSYYDMDRKEPKKELTEQERYYVASKLMQMELPIEEIDLFFHKTVLEKPSDPIEAYLRMIDKLEYYKEKMGLQETLKLLQSLVHEILSTVGEDYKVWCESLENELAKVTSIISKTNEFEIEQARILLEREKQKRKEFQ